MIPEIIAHAARAFNVTRADIIGHSRLLCHVRPRQAVAYALKKRGKMSLTDIGHHLGRKDHSTIVHAVRRVEALMEHDPAFRATVEAMVAMRPDTPPYVAPERSKAAWKKPPAPKVDTDVTEYQQRKIDMRRGSAALLEALRLAA